MTPDAAQLRQHYASLSDDALLEVDRSELTEMGRQCYDEELASRKLASEPDRDEEDAPEWLEEAACACSFASLPGNDSAPDLEQARIILESSGIPCYVKVEEADASIDGPRPRYNYELLVPGVLILPATSILDKQLFNPRQEDEWRNHLGELSDEDFQALNLEDLTAGLVDRLERLERVYHEELARRK